MTIIIGTLFVVITLLLCYATYLITHHRDAKKFSLIEMSVAQENFDSGQEEGKKINALEHIHIDSYNNPNEMLNVPLKRALTLIHWLKEELMLVVAEKQTLDLLWKKLLRSSSFTLNEKLMMIHELGTLMIVSHVSIREFSHTRKIFVEEITKAHGGRAAAKVVKQDMVGSSLMEAVSNLLANLDKVKSDPSSKHKIVRVETIEDMAHVANGHGEPPPAVEPPNDAPEPTEKDPNSIISNL